MSDHEKAAQPAKAPYSKPTLTEYGLLRERTRRMTDPLSLDITPYPEAISPSIVSVIFDTGRS